MTDTWPGSRLERCTCSGVIVAVIGRETEAVQRHQLRPEHRAWRLAGGMWATLDGTLASPRDRRAARAAAR